MGIDKDLLLGLAKEAPHLTMKMGDSTYDVADASIVYSEVPVTKPTTRGGVYFADKMAFKIRARMRDPSVSSLLSKTMLGPNSDFKTILFETTVGDAHLTISAHLTNYVQKADGLEMSLTVVGTNLSD